MAINHSDHAHPNTSAARAACRKVNAQPGVMTDEKRRPVTDELLAKREELNGKRLRASQAKAAAMQGKRGECFVCGSRAGWIDIENGEPVCIKHVDYDRCKILPL